MHIRIVGSIAIVDSDTPILTDEQSALDLIGTVRYEHGIFRIAIHQAAIHPDFFRLSTGVAGEVVQKFVNYRCPLAIIGDFSGYTSDALQRYMAECNRGKEINFVADEAEAVQRLAG